MPLFEYQCRSCSHRFEALVRGDGAATCPACNGQELEKLLSVFAVNTQGAGSEPRGEAGRCEGCCGDPRGPGACMMS